MRLLTTFVLAFICGIASGNEVVKNGTKEWFDLLELAYAQSPECLAYTNQAKAVAKPYQDRIRAAAEQERYDDMPLISREMNNAVSPYAAKAVACGKKWVKDNQGIILE